MNKFSFACCAAFLGVVLAGSAQSQTRNCAPHEVVVERLASGYGESRQVIAMNADSSVLEVFASEESGTWTIAVTRAGGLTCIVAAGQHYQHLAEDLPTEGVEG